jgi:ribosomal protein S3AE
MVGDKVKLNGRVMEISLKDLQQYGLQLWKKLKLKEK